jgi:ribosome assembly protein 1
MKIISALDLKIAPRDLRTKDTRHTLQLIFSQWLSLSTCTFQTVVEIVPPPEVAQGKRVRKMIYPELQVLCFPPFYLTSCFRFLRGRISDGCNSQLQESAVQPKNKFETDLFSCRNGDGADGANVVAIVSKMFAVPRDRIPRSLKSKEDDPPKTTNFPADKNPAASTGTSTSMENLRLEDEDQGVANSKDQDHVPHEESEEVMLGFARLYSGTLTAANTSSISDLYALLPKYNTSLPPSHSRNKQFVVGPLKVKALYEMMGRDLVHVESVKAGSVFAVEGLEGLVGRSATICAATREDMKSGKPVETFVNLAAANSGVCPSKSSICT